MPQLKINPGLRMVELPGGSVQFGVGAGGLVIEGTGPRDRCFLMKLRQGFAAADLDHVRAGCGLPEDRARSLLEALAPVLVSGLGRGRLTGLRADRLSPDARHWSAVYAADSEGALAGRGHCVVQLIGLSRTGAALACALGAAGIGTLLLEDPHVVGPADVGSGAFRLADIGLRRTEAVRRTVRQIDPTVSCHVLSGTTAEQGEAGIFPRMLSLAVAVSQDVPDQHLGAVLMSRGHPHLNVVVRENDLLVGPLVVPGTTSCLQCVELHRAEADPSWPEVAARLAAPPAGRGPGPSPADEISQSVAAAGLAAMQTLLFLDGRHRPGSFSSVLRLNSSDGSVTRHAFAPHQGCGCTLAAAS